MSSIQACALPEQALLAKYAQGGAYTDCYETEVAGSVSQAEYVEAFYTGAVFKLERLLLSWFASKPSTDAEAKELACGAASHFAVWRVEERSADQLLMSDLSGRTRSWLMAAPGRRGITTSTRLYFGSAVVPVPDKTSGRSRMGFVFRALLGFHRLYSRVLLSTGCSRLAQCRNTKHGPRNDA